MLLKFLKLIKRQIYLYGNDGPVLFLEPRRKHRNRTEVRGDVRAREPATAGTPSVTETRKLPAHMLTVSAPDTVLNEYSRKLEEGTCKAEDCSRLSLQLTVLQKERGTTTPDDSAPTRRMNTMPTVFLFRRTLRNHHRRSREDQRGALTEPASDQVVGGEVLEDGSCRAFRYSRGLIALGASKTYAIRFGERHYYLNADLSFAT